MSTHKLVPVLVCFVALSLSSGLAVAYQKDSSISYSSSSHTVSGESETWRDPWDLDQYNCGYYVWDDLFGYYCYVWLLSYNNPSVDADLVFPGGGVQSKGYDVDVEHATVSYNVTPTLRGLHKAQGAHFVEQDGYAMYCPYNMCTPWIYVDHNTYSLGSTQAQTNIPCIHHGTPQNGSLTLDDSLSDNGTGYYHFLGSDAPNTDDWACQDYAHTKIASIGLWWNQSSKIGIGDLSRQGGGSFSPHASHQNGLDLDVRYMRNDGQEAPLNFDTNPQLYDQGKTQAVVQQFCLLGGASVIFVDARANLSASCVSVASGHNDHIHVRLPDVDGTGN